MKPKVSFHSFLLACGTLLAAVPSLHAATYYWDNNGATGGFGVASGTWAEPTLNQWNTNSAGGNAMQASRTILIGDDVFFGNGATGLGAGTITVSGTVDVRNITFASGSGAIILSGGTINLGATSVITVDNATDTISSILSGAGTSLTKAGAGTLVLTEANSYTGATIINAGTLDLGGGGATGSLASTVLTLSGGSFSYTRNDSATHSFTTTNVNGVGSAISAASGNTLNLGTVARATGATLDFSSTGAGTVAADTASNVGGIMSGFTFGDTWAVANGAGVAISGLLDGSYTLSNVAGTTGTSYDGNNIDVNNSAGTLDAGIAANSLRFSAVGANTLSLTGTNTLTTGGILVGSGVGSNLSAITGGTLAGSASGDLSIIQNNTSGGLTISSDIINNGGATALTKSGAGLLTISGNNSFTGALYINEGEVAMGSTGALTNANDVIFGSSGGTLSLNGNSVSTRSLSGPSAAIVQNASATAATLTTGTADSTFSGVIQDGSGVGSLSLIKVGNGALTLTGTNTYSGGTTISGGTVNVGSANAFGTGAITVTGNSNLYAQYNVFPTINNALDVNNGVTLTAGGSNQYYGLTVDGVLSGTGTIKYGGNEANGASVYSLDFGNAANTFNGTLESTGGSAILAVNSLGSGASLVLNGGQFILNSGTASSLDLGQVTLKGSATIANNNASSSNTITINTDMAIASTGNKTLILSGNNLGVNTFGGNIDDGSFSAATQVVDIRKEGNGTWTLGGTNSYSGETYVRSGTLVVSSLKDLGIASSIGTGTLALGYYTTTGTLQYVGAGDSTNRSIRINGGAGTNYGGATILNDGSGALTFTASTFNPTVLGASRDRVLTLGGTYSGGANEIQGIIQNTDTLSLTSVVKQNDASTWTLSGSNTYTGSTTISGGILNFANVAAKSAGTTVTAGAAGSVGLGVKASDAAYYSATNVGDLFNTNSLTGYALNAASGVAIDTTNAGGSFDQTVALTAARSLTKLGTGTLILSQTNTYTGATTVSVGTLLVNGSIATSSLTTVASGATIGGSGTIGALTVSSGGFINPGNSPDILTVAGDYTQAGLYSAEIIGLTAGVTGHDQIDVTGAVDITGGSLTALFSAGSYTANDLIFILLNDGTDAITGTYAGLADGATVTNYGGYDWTISYFADSGTGFSTGGNDIALLAVAPIPEPRAVLLGCLGVLLLLRRRR